MIKSHFVLNKQYSIKGNAKFYTNVASVIIYDGVRDRREWNEKIIIKLCTEHPRTVFSKVGEVTPLGRAMKLSRRAPDASILLR